MAIIVIFLDNLVTKTYGVFVLSLFFFFGRQYMQFFKESAKNKNLQTTDLDVCNSILLNQNISHFIMELQIGEPTLMV